MSSFYTEYDFSVTRTHSKCALLKKKKSYFHLKNVSICCRDTICPPSLSARTETRLPVTFLFQRKAQM